MTAFTVFLYKREPTDDDTRMWLPVLSKPVEEIHAYAEAHKDDEVDVTSNEMTVLLYFIFCAEYETCPCLGCTAEMLKETNGASTQDTYEAFRGLLEKGWVDIGGPVDVRLAN